MMLMNYTGLSYKTNKSKYIKYEARDNYTREAKRD